MKKNRLVNYFFLDKNGRYDKLKGFTFCFSLVIIIMCLTGIILSCNPEYNSLRTTWQNEYHQYNAHWIREMDDGTDVDFDQFNENIYAQRITLRRTLTVDERLTNLSFSNYYSAVEVYLNDERIYSYGKPSDVETHVLLGATTLIVKIPAYAEGDTLRVIFHGNEQQRVQGFYCGNGDALLQRVYADTLAPAVATVMIFCLFLYLFIQVSYGNIYTQKYHFLLTFIFVLGLWVITDIPLLPMFGCSPGRLSMLANESFMFLLIPVSLFFYYNCKRWHYLDLFVVTANMVNFIVMNILFFTQNVCILEVIKVSNFFMAISLALGFIRIIYEHITERTEFTKFTLIGYCFIIVAEICQYARYMYDPTKTNSFYAVIGALIFLFCQTIHVMRTVIEKTREGTRAETYLTMAKRDALTGLRNRLSLDLAIKDIVNRDLGMARMGCVVCDLNNLKLTNDKYGHLAGDELLKNFGDLLHDCYQGYGKVYRAGGDEFYTLFVNKDVDTTSTLHMLNKALDRYNKTMTNTLKISVAIGVHFELADSSDPQNIWNIIKQADSDMYFNKKKFHDSEKNN